MKSKKFLALLLATAMTTGLMACGNTSKETGNKSSEVKEESKTSESASTPVSEEKEEIDLSYPIQDAQGLSIFNIGLPLPDDQNDWKNVPFWQGLQENTGVTLDVQFPAAGADWNNEVGVEVTKYLAEMHASKKLAVGLDVTELISNHKLGAWFGGSWELQGFKEALGDDLGMATIPTFDVNGQQVQMKSFYGSKAIGVNAKSANPAAAVAFATFLGSEEQQVARFEQTQIVPANMKAAEADAAGAGVQ